MAIIDYKEKYEQALEVAQRFYNNSVAITKKGLEYIFPELVESEDERIKKFLKLIIGEWSYDDLSAKGFKKENIIAWLEKKGVQKSIWHNEDEEPQKDSLILLIMQSGTPIVAKIIEPNHTFTHGERWAYIDDLLEKQGEKGMVLRDTFGYEEGRQKGQEEGIMLVLDNPQKYGLEKQEQKPAWSEWNRILQDSSINYLCNLRDTFEAKGWDKEQIQKCINWLKSLRPHNRNITDEELAQAKKEAYNGALDKIEYHSGEPTFDDGWDAAIWYLKKRNTMPQNIWKPSKEQMSFLKGYAEEDMVLQSLYNDLKKLREE